MCKKDYFAEIMHLKPSRVSIVKYYKKIQNFNN